MVVTVSIFLWVNGIIIAILLAFLALLWRQKSDIAPIASLAKRIQAKAIDEWLEKRGLGGKIPEQRIASNARQHSLPPERAARRGELISLGKTHGLSEEDAAELQALLQEDARDDFARGILGGLAFIALMMAIAAIIRSLSRR